MTDDLFTEDASGAQPQAAYLETPYEVDGPGEPPALHVDGIWRSWELSGSGLIADVRTELERRAEELEEQGRNLETVRRELEEYR